MNILALDCATKTGWASLIGGQITSGVQDFTKKRGESNGMIFLRFNAWLKELSQKNHGFALQYEGADYHMFDVLAFEQAHHRGGAATEICVGMTAFVMKFAVEYGAEHMAVHTASIKKFATEKGNASKEDMCYWFKKTIGHEPIDDNEADAMALLHFARKELGI